VIFVQALVTPKSTAATAPVVTRIPLVRGTITLVSIQFPPGCNGLAHCQLRYGLYQLFPSNQSADFATGGETIAWVEQTVIDADPRELTAVSWNTDTAFDHTITVRIVMQPVAANTANQVIAEVFAQQGAAAPATAAGPAGTVVGGGVAAAPTGPALSPVEPDASAQQFASAQVLEQLPAQNSPPSLGSEIVTPQTAPRAVGPSNVGTV
jgi:hypothetical protein